MAENILIVSYSYSGNTHRIAEEIGRQTGGRLCGIYPRQPYPSSFESLLAQVREEVRQGKKPALLPVSDSAENYDIIFVGSPNWCGTIAPPAASWLDRNDLQGKLILPFFSHCGGDRGNMEKAFLELCPGARLGESLYVLSDGKENLEKIVAAWLQKTLKEAKSA